MNRSFRLGLLGLALIGLGLTLWVSRRDKPETVSMDLEGWVLVSGAADKRDSGLVALEDLELRLGETTLRVSSGTRLDWETERAGGADAKGQVVLPVVLEGSVEVESGDRLRLSELEIKPQSRVKLSITPLAIRVIDGVIAIKDQLVRAGESFSRILGGRLAEKPADPATQIPTGSTPTWKQPATGRVIDARDGTPLSGVRVRATHAHTVDGYPSFPDRESQSVVWTAEDGSFRIKPFHPEDPRLFLHLEILEPGYLPKVQVIETPADSKGLRPPLTVSLRQARTKHVQFLDPDREPLAGAAVKITELHADTFLGHDTWENQSVSRGDRSVIRYTDGRGRLLLGRERVKVELCHPSLYLWSQECLELLRHLELPPSEDEHAARLGPYEINTRLGKAEDYTLENLRGHHVGDALVELTLSGMPTIRLYTDDAGQFTFAPWPKPHGTDLTVNTPRRGELLSLSPLYYKSHQHVSFPSQNRTIALETRRAGELRLRSVLKSDTDEITILPPEEIQSDRKDLTLVRRDGSTGEVIFQGVLPDVGEELALFLRGYLPEIIRMPPRRPEDLFVDLGDVVFDRGETLSIRIIASEESRLADAELWIADTEFPIHQQRYRFADRREIRIGGLLRGRSYEFALEAKDAIEQLDGEILVSEELLEAGLDLTPVPERDRDVRVTARSFAIDLEESDRYRVHERYYVQDNVGEDGELLSFATYPLPPDGRFGSLRRIPEPEQVEVFIVGPGIDAAHTLRRRIGDSGVFDLGRVELTAFSHASIAFEVEGLGRVLPPEVSLRARENRYDEIARISTQADGTLFIRALMPGDYELSWEEESERRSIVLEVPSDPEPIFRRIPRRALAIEEIRIRVEDTDGNPIDGLIVAKVEDGPDDGGAGPPRPAASSRAPTESGFYSLFVRPTEPTEFLFHAPDFLPARLRLEPNREYPEVVTLQRGARIRAIFKDVDGRNLVGSLNVSWIPVLPGETRPGETPSPDFSPQEISHGAAFPISSRSGIFESDHFPPGRHRFTFRLAHSEASATVFLELAESEGHALGTIRLEESRSLRGTVQLPDGKAASGARVAIVTADGFYRFPQQPLELEGQPYGARCDPLGQFRIDGLPLDLTEDLALVAHLDGWTDAVESPLDLELEAHDLVLDDLAALAIDAGYRDGLAHESYRFDLWYRESGDSESFELIGRFLPAAPGGLLFEGVTPGEYRISWDLVDRHPSSLPRLSEAVVEPGYSSRLTLRVEDHFLSGSATFNGATLSRGWILVTDNPGNPDLTRFGRVLQGEFEVPVPRRAEELYGSLIPERDPIPIPNFRRGEALPEYLGKVAAILSSGSFDMHDEAHDLTCRFTEKLRSLFPELEIRLPRYEWTRNGFERELDTEPVVDGEYRLELLPPGNFPLTVLSTRGYRFFQYVVLDQDVVLTLRR